MERDTTTSAGNDATRTDDNDADPGIPQTERIAMAGMIELYIGAESAFRFRLIAPDGTVMAVSKPFSTKTDAVAGIAAFREYADMGLITDSCAEIPPTKPRTYVPKIDFHARARAVRRAVSEPRWAGVIHNLS